MIHKQEFIPLPHPLPHPLSHPHPQFVAVNSLMLNPPNFSYTVSYGIEENVLQFLKNKFFLLLRYKNGFAIVKLIITIKV